MKLGNRPQSVGAFARQLQDFDSVKDFFTSISLVTLVDLLFNFAVPVPYRLARWCNDVYPSRNYACADCA